MCIRDRSVILKVDKNTNLTLNKTAIAGLAGKVSDTNFEGES